MSDLTPDEFLDGFALWQEHKPQLPEDYVRVAERILADPNRDSYLNPSPIFGALLMAVAERDAARAAVPSGGKGGQPDD